MCVLKPIYREQAIHPSTLSFVIKRIRSSIEQGNKDFAMSSYRNAENGYGTVGRDNQTLSERDPEHRKAYLAGNSITHGRVASVWLALL